MEALKNFINYTLLMPLINWAFPQYVRPKYNYLKPHEIFFNYFIPQKILRINGGVPWPVHFTSKVTGYHNIKKGVMCDPGDNPNIYIQAINGIIIGNNVGFGAGTAIISANHNHNEHSLHDYTPPIEIGNNVFVGANSVILPGVKIGNNVVIGAGSVVCKDIPSDCIAVGNPCKPIKTKEKYIEKYDAVEMNRPLPKDFSWE